VYGLAIPFFLDGIFALCACILALFLIEPPRTKMDSLLDLRSILSSNEHIITKKSGG
jgi:hypothetical protein